MALSEKKRRWFEAHTGQLTIAFVTQHSYHHDECFSQGCLVFRGSASEFSFSSSA